MRSVWNHSATTRLAITAELDVNTVHKAESVGIYCTLLLYPRFLSVCGCCRVFTSTTESVWTPGCFCSTPVLCANVASSVSSTQVLFTSHSNKRECFEFRLSLILSRQRLQRQLTLASACSAAALSLDHRPHRLPSYL